jgi:hypothetical protein
MTTTTKTPVNSIEIPVRFVHACVGWTGGTDCMLYAVTSTGNLTTGTDCPAGCDGDPEKWYLTLWRELSADLGCVVRMALDAWDGIHDSDSYNDWIGLGEFETWTDEIVARLEDEYGLTDWDACDACDDCAGHLCEGCYCDPCECLPNDCNCDPE